MKTFDLPKDHGSNKTWMDVTLPSVEVFVKRNGFGLVSDPNQTSCSYFEIGAAMHEELGKATNELHIMFIAAAEYVLNHPELWKHFEFPPVFWEMAVKSFANRSETLTGRMDFSITEKHGIKCYEYNADSASCLMECGYTQGAWAVAAEIDKYGEDAGSVTADNVTAAWKKTVPSGTLVHFLRDDDGGAYRVARAGTGSRASVSNAGRHPDLRHCARTRVRRGRRRLPRRPARRDRCRRRLCGIHRILRTL